jgi:integrase/recombinase XerC
VRQAVIAVKSFFSWCLEEHMLADDPSGALKVPKIPRRVLRSLRPDEVLALLRATQQAPGRGVTHEQAAAVALRNAAIVSLLYDSLLRAAELCRLRVAELDLARRVLTVQVKGGHQAHARFGVETAERLRAWLAVRVPAEGVDTVFVSIAGNTPGQALTTTGLRIIVRHIGDVAGVPGVSPHAFRRGGAVAAIEAGAPTRAVQEFGRWSSVQMVELYTRAMDADLLYDEYSPIHRLPEDPAEAPAEAAVEVNRKPGK